MGKAQPLDARIKTLTGWKRMGDLRLGDRLASVDGRRSVVSGLFPQGRRQVYRVTFSDGRSTECCDEHLWRVHSRDWRAPRLLTTKRVAEMLGRKRYRHRLWIDAPAGVDGDAAALPIDPWLLGALLGEGKLSGTSLIFSTSDAAMLEQLLERTREGFTLRAVGGYDWRIVQATGAALGWGAPLAAGVRSEAGGRRTALVERRGLADEPSCATSTTRTPKRSSGSR